MQSGNSPFHEDRKAWHRQELLIRKRLCAAPGSRWKLPVSASKCAIGHKDSPSANFEMGFITIWNASDSCWERVLSQGARHTELQEHIAEGEAPDSIAEVLPSSMLPMCTVASTCCLQLSRLRWGFKASRCLQAYEIDPSLLQQGSHLLCCSRPAGCPYLLPSPVVPLQTCQKHHLTVHVPGCKQLPENQSCR